jgi:X-X-X-Leu-X-X-Gly heptad repeat protein
VTAARITRGLAITVAVPTALFLTSSTALAASAGATADPVGVTNTETVRAQLDPSGKVQGARVYEQLSFTGKGRAKVANPVATDGLRNLDGFGGLSVKNGSMNVDLAVDGEERLRTVSDFDKSKLPIKVAVTYTLNGKKLRKPSDAVGKRGRLAAQYVVENTSAKPRTITVTDGYGKKVSEETDVVIPMVGQLVTVLPPGFADVSSNEANKAGDGKGGTRLSFTVTLFPPVGAASAEFGWSADVKDAVIPEAELTALPVSPLDSPTFKTAVDGYDSGAQKGTDLVDGGTALDANLIKLRDGAEKLLTGLLQLNEGAKTLNAGLADQAAPGADKLSTGAKELRNGLGELDRGAGLLREKTGEAAKGADKLDKGAGDLQKGTKSLDAGADQLKTGTGKLADGLGQATKKAPALVDGLNQVSGGLKGVEDGLVQMYGGVGGLPAKAKPLHAGVKQLRDGIGSVSDGDTLLGGLETLKKQLAAAGPGIDKMRGGVHCASDALNAVSNGKPVGTYDAACYGAAAAALNGPAGGLNTDPESNPVKKLILDSLLAQLGSISDPAPDLDKALPDDAKLQAALAYLKGRLTERAVPGIGKLQCGLDNRVAGCPSSAAGLVQGLGLVDAGVGALVSGVVASVQGGIGDSNDAPANKTLRGGINGLQSGVEQIQSGGKTLLAGLNELSDGATQLDTGAGALAAGTQRLKAGTGVLVNGTSQLDNGLFLLADGTGRLADGVGKASSGSELLATGSSDLATGIGGAAEGSKKLSDGLQTAADGAPALPQGVNRLSTEGAKVLTASGAETALDFGRRTAVLTASADRAKTEAMPVGAPEGATATSAYSLKLAGASGEGGRSWVRLLAAVGVCVLAVGGVGLIRRRFAA